MGQLDNTYLEIFENSADGMFLMTDVFTECNDAVCKLFHCKKEDIIGKSPLEFSPEFQPDGKSSVESANEKISRAFLGIQQRFYWQHKTKDNVLFDADVALSLITIEGKKVVYAVVRDISENKRLEKVQKALFDISEAAYTATDMVSLYKRIHEIVSTLMLANNFYIAMYDESTEMISFPYMVDEFDPPYPPKKLSKGLTEYILRTGEAKLIDSRLDLELRETGEVEMIGTPTLIWLGVPLIVSDKTIGVIVVQDYQNAETYGEPEKQLLVFVAKQIAQVIERKRNSEAIKVYAEQLKELNQTKDKFFSIIAHDLKSPFQSLLGLSELLTSPDSDLSLEEKEEYIQTLFTLLKNQYELLQNLLEWGAMQLGKSEYNPVKLNLSEAVDTKIELLSKNAKNKSISVVNEISKDVFVLSDKHIIGSIIQNFLANAIKFTNRNGTIKIYSAYEKDFIVTTVEDNGVGMSKEALKNIYSLGEVNTTQGTEGELGTGLGVMLCKEMIEKNGGSLKIESEVGKGTKVIFTIPAPKDN
jgi:PAS domain S-box-containing protein